MRDWRALTWVIVVVNILFLVWVIGGIASTGGACEGLTGSELDACEAGTAIGATIGVAAIVGLWVVVDIILGIVWLVTNTRKRECPACGKKVKKGVTRCTNCGHDFAAAASGGGSGEPRAT